MHTARPLTRQSRKLYVLALFIGLIPVLSGAIAQWPSAIAQLVSGDNDDIMRLMQVRAWLDGQSWFDLTQYRVLPPEGISLHWSRYIDLGIAAILVPLSWIMPMAQAEHWTLVVWPTLLMILLVVVVVRGTVQSLGGVAACGAAATLVTWLPISGLYFEAGRIDHHSVQILVTTVLAFAIAVPGGPIRRGIIAGVTAAFSLAVGLETVLFIMVAGTILLVRSAFEREGADRLLAAFCVTLTAASAVLFVGQTAPAAWLHPACDKLSPPVLLLALIATAASLGPMAAKRWLTNPVKRIVASGVLAGIGLWLCAPILSPCIGGPYGALPLDLRIMITRDILEAQPALVYGRAYPLSFNSFFTPVLVASGISAAFWLRQMWHATQPAAERAAVAQMLIFACVGLIGSLFQLRMIILATPAMPFLAGYVTRSLMDARQQNPTPRSSLLLITGLITMFGATQLNGVISGLVAATRGDAVAGNLNGSLDRNCRSLGDLETLNTLPPSTIMTTMNLAPALILTTHHNAIAAPYHRSAETMWNGTYQFNNFGAMQHALKTSGATYVVLCRTTTYAPRRMAARALIAGDIPPWLRPVPFDNEDFLIFAVVPEALAQQP